MSSSAKIVSPGRPATPARRNPYRDLPTGALLAAKECVAWDRADLAADPDRWDFPEQSTAFLGVVAAEVDAELDRRERLRAQPLAPAWPDRRGELDDIKRRVELAAFVEKWTARDFRRVGAQLRAYCPFPDHEAHSRGFVVHPEKQLFWCFGCLRGGDVFDFALEFFNLGSFAQAVDLVALEAGVPRTRRGARRTPAGRGRARVGSVRVA